MFGVGSQYGHWRSPIEIHLKNIFAVDFGLKKITKCALHNNKFDSDITATIPHFLRMDAIVSEKLKRPKVLKIENRRLGDLDG